MTENEMIEKIESLKTPQGGWSKESLSSLGVSWPPPKGWKENLLKECND
jgi:hypothetical protein